MPDDEVSDQMIYLVELRRDDDEGSIYQFGAFRTKAVAKEVMNILETEGHHSPLTINSVTIFDTADDWYRGR